MSDEKKVKQRKIMKWIFWRIPIGLLMFGAVLIGALKLVERYPDPLRQGFEQYLSNTTGRNATIGKLDEVKFFPNFIIDAKNITVHNLKNAAIIDLEIKNLNLNAPFFSLFSGGGKINNLSIKNLSANEGMFSSQAIEIISVDIVEKKGPDQFGSFLVSKGSYGGKEMLFESKMEVGKYSYNIPSPVSFSLRIGLYEVNAAFKKKGTKLILENAVFGIGEKRSEAEDFILAEKKEYQSDNPLNCMLTHKDLNDCNKYLEGK